MDMKKHSDRKGWVTPAVRMLKITRDTFGGSTVFAEGQAKGAASIPKDPNPR